MRIANYRTICTQSVVYELIGVAENDLSIISCGVIMSVIFFSLIMQLFIFFNKSIIDAMNFAVLNTVYQTKTMSTEYKKFTEKYGNHVSQEGDLYIPTGQPKAILCLFHGGFWRFPYGRDQFDSVAICFAKAGYIVWNIEYRRVGEINGGWPGTFEDVILAVNHLNALQLKYRWSDDLKVILSGHSAGGQLALWLTAHAEKNFKQHTPLIVNPDLCIGLAPVTGFEKAYQENLGGQAVHKLLGCTPKENPELYKLYDPLLTLPQFTAQIIIHGLMDDDLPVSYSQTYVRTANAERIHVDLIELENTGHMDFLEPQSLAVQSWKTLLDLRYGVHK